MKKHLLIAATAIALVLPGLSSAAFAESHEHGKFSAEDVSAFADAKIAGLKAGLKLTPAQEKNWPTLETALRDIGKARAARAAEAREKFKEHHEHPNVIEGLRLRSKLLAARAADFEKLSDAAKPLYDSLDDAQKRRFHVLLHVIARGHGHHWDEHDGGHEDKDGH
ncbi:MAG: hypothetical protein C3F11_10860 [Methylocystaceae bacterium]|nr:MAG: hypothetical protein C3F11_10860 [Methylocystaceae bacterium]